jgi:type III pantothenate kinase
MILCDIGNSRMHVWTDGVVQHLSHREGLRRFGGERVHYICVHPRMKERIAKEAPKWVDLADRRCLKSAYRGLGIDREAACLGVWDGIVVDAGSAITVDVMEEGLHRGGWIWPGIAALRRAYADISPVLDRPPVQSVALEVAPMDTDAAVGFGILAPIACVVERFRKGKRVVVTGGDAEIVASVIPGAIVDETVVFEGMKKMLQKDRAC